jgi:hypothetical protein
VVGCLVCAAGAAGAAGAGGGGEGVGGGGGCGPSDSFVRDERKERNGRARGARCGVVARGPAGDARARRRRARRRHDAGIQKAERIVLRERARDAGVGAVVSASDGSTSGRGAARGTAPQIGGSESDGPTGRETRVASREGGGRTAGRASLVFGRAASRERRRASGADARVRRARRGRVPRRLLPPSRKRS